MVFQLAGKPEVENTHPKESWVSLALSNEEIQLNLI